MTATMRRGGSLLVTFACGALVGGALIGGCQNPIPENPSYATDIAPLMTAKCTRCHSAAGMASPDPLMAPIMNVMKAVGDFTTMSGVMTFNCSALFNQFVLQIGMPPPPSDRLDDWSVQLIQQWCASGEKP
jgi:hypothetical protein